MKRFGKEGVAAMGNSMESFLNGLVAFILVFAVLCVIKWIKRKLLSYIRKMNDKKFQQNQNDEMYQ